MANFSRVQEFCEATGGLEGTARLQDQIKMILSAAQAEGGTECEQEFTGDGGIFIVERAENAHAMALTIFRFSERYSEPWRRRKTAATEIGVRCFRIGIAFGELSRDQQKKVAGPAISMAKRLEEGGNTGEVRISPDAYRQLPLPMRRLYGGEEILRGKAHDGVDGQLPVHRLVVAPHAPWETNAPVPVENPEFRPEAIAGLRRIYPPPFSVDVAVRGFTQARRRIRIFSTWLPFAVMTVQAISEAAKCGCIVQILLLDPRSPLAEQRGLDLGFPDRTRVSNDIKSSVYELIRHCETEGVRHAVEIRLYSDTTPTMIIIAYDDTILFSPYLRKHSLQSHFFELRLAKGGYGEELDAYFDEVWARSNPSSRDL